MEMESVALLARCVCMVDWDSVTLHGDIFSDIESLNVIENVTV